MPHKYRVIVHHIFHNNNCVEDLSDAPEKLIILKSNYINVLLGLR